jgi:hypothetical protein
MQSQSEFVMGQRYAFATLAMVVALLSFINLAGMEKAILAIVLGYKALTLAPVPALERRRGWAKAGAALGATHIVLVVTVILLNLDRLSKVVEVLRAMSDVK